MKDGHEISDLSPNKNNEEKSLLGFDDLENFTENGFKLLVEATKSANKLPTGKKRDLYESYPSFLKLVQDQGNEILSCLSMVLKNINFKGNILRRDDEDKFEMVVDVNDSILEKVGTSLDELSGVHKNPDVDILEKKNESFNSSWNMTSNLLDPGRSTQILNSILNKTKNIEKPQLKFDDEVNNDQNIPFIPRINHKYNMIEPLKLTLETNTDDSVCQYLHPYETELSKFKPSEDILKFQEPKSYKSLSDTPFRLITTPDKVSTMVEELLECKEISVDLEHHSYRSFQGFTCLLQISSRDCDYIIDTLPLRSHLLVLNKIFTNPSILKVFHGADMDILWLQRDLCIYVVNMFDTHQAAKLLGFPKLSLAYLLKYFCNVNAQKHFQLADWRIRPLPEELINYAREDTHYLLYIYDNLRNALLEKANGKTNLLESVISESTRLCLKRYKKPIYDKDGYLDMYHRSKKLFDNRQKFALERLYEWRDKIARELDESLAYVLPNHMMLNISESLPREMQGILACCNPVPVPVRQYLLVLHQMILKAREQPLIKPILEEETVHRFTATMNNFDNPIMCPHDLNHDAEFRDDLPVLLKNNDSRKSESNNNSNKQIEICSDPIINVFESSGLVLENRLKGLIKKRTHLSPYDKYKLAKKFSESLEVKKLNSSVKKLEKEEEKLPVDSSIGEKEPIEPSNLQPVHEFKKPIKKNTLKNNQTTLRNAKKRRLSAEAPALLSNVKSPRLDQNVETSQLPQESKKLKKKNKKEKLFSPYDYKSVDFNQYKSAVTSSKAKTKKTFKSHRKISKKKTKISI